MTYRTFFHLFIYIQNVFSGSQGVRANSMRPVFPTMTFVNHYTIATVSMKYKNMIEELINNMMRKDADMRSEGSTTSPLNK